MAVLSDPIADFLTRVKNAGVARNEGFTAPYSGIKAEIARILQAGIAQEGCLFVCESGNPHIFEGHADIEPRFDVVKYARYGAAFVHILRLKAEGEI